MPAHMAIKAAVKIRMVVLQALGAAAGAQRTAVQPVPVGVDAILDVVAVYRYVKGSGKLLRMVPSGNFQVEELKVGLVGRVLEQTVAGLVQQGPYAGRLCVLRVIIKNLAGFRTPIERGASNKREMRIGCL